MNPYAVIETGGKQYRVWDGLKLEVERLPEQEGETIQLQRVLARSDGQRLEIGTPFLSTARVTAKILRHFRGKKVVSFKKKRRKGYSRKVGHRQERTLIRIESIV